MAPTFGKTGYSEFKKRIFYPRIKCVCTKWVLLLGVFGAMRAAFCIQLHPVYIYGVLYREKFSRFSCPCRFRENKNCNLLTSELLNCQHVDLDNMVFQDHKRPELNFIYAFSSPPDSQLHGIELCVLRLRHCGKAYGT